MLDDLETRREQSSLTFFYKIHSGTVDLDKDKYLTLAPNLRRTRASHESQYCNVGHHANKPRQWKSMLTHQGGLICLYMQPLLAPQTTEFAYLFISVLRTVTLLPPPRILVPRLGLGNTWVRQLRSGSCHYPTAATKCNVRRLAKKPCQWKSMLTHQGWFNLLIYATFTRTTNYRVCNLHIYLYPCSAPNPGRFAPKPFPPLVVSPPRRFPPGRFPPSRFAPTSRFAPLVVSPPSRFAPIILKQRINSYNSL